MPLALELAARWMKALTAEDLLQRLDTDVLLSAAGPRDLPERQQTMNATVAWSYQLLEADEQRAFRRFRALPGLFPIDAAAEVLAGRERGSDWTDEALRAAAGLLDKSLLSRAQTSVVATRPLYYMLETVRAYATLELAAAGERDDAMEGLVRYCTRGASLAAEGLVGSAQAEWLNRVHEDLENYRGALRWLCSANTTAGPLRGHAAGVLCQSRLIRVGAAAYWDHVAPSPFIALRDPPPLVRCRHACPPYADSASAAGGGELVSPEAAGALPRAPRHAATA